MSLSYTFIDQEFEIVIGGFGIQKFLPLRKNLVAAANYIPRLFFAVADQAVTEINEVHYGNDGG